MIEWLASPIDPARIHDIAGLTSWHGRGMVLAWGFLLPLGVIAARFFKVMPGQDWPREIENPTWWLAHRILQYSGLAVMALALLLILFADDPMPGARLHRWMGWSIVALAAIQFSAAMAHGTKGGPRAAGPDGSTFGDHYNMTPRRILFERVHKSLGYGLLALSIVSIVSGLWISNALRWMWSVQILWWLVLLAVCIVLQRRGRAIDTYQAIWGPHPEHPGNHRPPIGWGVRRVPLDDSIRPVSIRQRRAAGQPDR